MADKDTLRGFDILAENLLKPEGALKEDDDFSEVAPEDIKAEEEESQDEEKNKNKGTNDDVDEEDLDDNKGNSGDDSDDDLGDDNDDNQDFDSDDDNDTSGSDTDDLDDDKKFESEVTKWFTKKFADELGWDVKEEDAFDNVGDLVEYMEALVGEASKPRYSSEEIQKIDEFVRSGGKLEDYYKAISTGSINVDTVDITKESNQRLVIEENLRNLGYSEDRIKRSVDRYEDRGVLEEEAEDALELLKEYKEKNKEKLLENQENFRQQQIKEQQKFISNVEDNIQSLSDIAGSKLTAREKRELTDYILKPTRDGRTQYQIDYSENQVTNLIESAFFTKNKDKLVESIKKQASTNTLKDVQQKLKSSKGKRAKSSGQIDQGKSSVDLSVLGRQLLGK